MIYTFDRMLPYALTICSLRVRYSLHRADRLELALISNPTLLHSSQLVDTPSKMLPLWFGTDSSCKDLSVSSIMPHPLSKGSIGLSWAVVYAYPYTENIDQHRSDQLCIVSLFSQKCNLEPFSLPYIVPPTLSDNNTYYLHECCPLQVHKGALEMPE